ncbi:MAG TPA: hypothetical protein VFG91_13930 [Woeseiaceae bacterium]|nr:hypothetical protein [Woeseiaceae bacterium]
MLPPPRLLAIPALLYLPALAGAQHTAAPAVEPPLDDAYGAAAVLLTRLVFLLVPASLAVQVVALRKLEGRLLQLARFSACAMAALWLFVAVTAVAGSTLSPIWLVLLSPFFVLFLAVLLFVRSRAAADDASLLVRPR